MLLPHLFTLALLRRYIFCGTFPRVAPARYYLALYLYRVRTFLFNLIKKYKINSKSILGHSDIAPDRKLDPGEKFPWAFLSKNKIGIWHDLIQNKIKKERGLNISNPLKLKFINNLFKIGYPRSSKINKNKYNKIITFAFQRRFRQELVNGKIDKECLLISENLIKKLN